MEKILFFLIFSCFFSSYSYSEEFLKAKSFENWDVLMSFRDGRINTCHTVSKPSSGILTSLLAISYAEHGCFSFSINLSEDVLFTDVSDVFVYVGKVMHKLKPRLRGAVTFSAMQDKAIINDIIYESLENGYIDIEIQMKNGVKTIEKYPIHRLLDSMIYIEKNC